MVVTDIQWLFVLNAHFIDLCHIDGIVTLASVWSQKPSEFGVNEFESLIVLDP